MCNTLVAAAQYSQLAVSISFMALICLHDCKHGLTSHASHSQHLHGNQFLAYNLKYYRVSHLLANLGWVDLDL